MSLHGKIVAWFVFFASLTVLLFVLGDYIQSTRSLRMALEARGSALAGQVAVDIERRYEQAETELLTFGYELAGGGEVQPLVAPFRQVRVFRNDGLFRERATPAPAAATESCAFGEVTFRVPFRDRAGNRYRVDAVMPTAAFFASIPSAMPRFGTLGATTVIDRATGDLAYDPGCDIRSGALPGGLEAAVVAAATGDDSRRIRAGSLEGPFDGFVLATARAEHPLWTAAVIIDYDEFAAPFRTIHQQYLAVMIAVMGIALFFVLRMIRRDMKRLAAISSAADAIGRGRFDVWLPPPTGDDVGRLSLALGRMVNRLSSTLHQMEISRSMAAVGELASYLSHEIRNPLSSIRLNLQMLRRDLRSGSPPDDAPQLVALCLTELQRLDDVVRTVLELGREGNGKSDGSCYVHDVVLDTLQVMHSKLRGHGIEVETRFATVDTAVAIDPARLKSILINLLLNSVDALAGTPGGRITVTSELNEDVRGAPMIELRIADNGPGVPAHLRERIFEPFFTTKSTGNGIGLATALRMVQEAGGLLRCAPPSEWSGGAEFVLELSLAGHAHPSAGEGVPLAAGRT
jgi:signal transduction histidine kinase